MAVTPTSLAELGPPPSGGTPTPAAADLIGNDLAGGEKQGYKFTLTGNQGGYIITATPVTYGTSGSKSLLFRSDHGHPGELRSRTRDCRQQGNPLRIFGSATSRER